MLKIIFQNQHFVAVDKPAGWLSVPSRWGTDEERPCVGLLLQEQLRSKIYPVHRLDEPVSGLLLFALNAAAHRAANAWFADHHIQKTYEAMTTHQDGA